MKKLAMLFSIFLFLSFNISTVNTLAQAKSYSQGFYTLRDLTLYEGNIYTVQNVEPYADGLLIITDSNQTIQQLIRIPPSSIKYTLIPLKDDYKLIVSGNIRLTFS